MLEAGVRVAGPLIATSITGGRSNVTVRLDDGSSSWVLRMPPRTGRTPSAQDVAREFAFNAALTDSGVPVPPAVLFCQDETVVGASFAVWEFVPGRAVQRAGDLETLSADQLAQVVGELVETLATLHRVDHRAAGLAEFERPGQYAERQLRR